VSGIPVLGRNSAIPRGAPNHRERGGYRVPQSGTTGAWGFPRLERPTLMTHSHIGTGRRLAGWTGVAARSVSSVTPPFWEHPVKDVQLVKVIGLEFPFSPGKDDGYGKCLTSA